MDEIRKRHKRTKKGRYFSLEQKVMLVKLLQLSGMNYTEISKETGVSRITFYKWKEELGDIVFTADHPDKRKSPSALRRASSGKAR